MKTHTFTIAESRGRLPGCMLVSTICSPPPCPRTSFFFTVARLTRFYDPLTPWCTYHPYPRLVDFVLRTRARARACASRHYRNAHPLKYRVVVGVTIEEGVHTRFRFFCNFAYYFPPIFEKLRLDRGNVRLVHTLNHPGRDYSRRYSLRLHDIEL